MHPEKTLISLKWVHPEKTFLQNGCTKRKLFLKMGLSRENLSSKWVLPEKTYPQNGCMKKKLFFKMGASRENFSSKWVHSQKAFAAKLMHQNKTLLQNGCIKSLSFTKFKKIIFLFLKVSLHVMKVSLLMWFSLSLITSQSRNFEANAADQWKDPFLVFSGKQEIGGPLKDTNKTSATYASKAKALSPSSALQL